MKMLMTTAAVAALAIGGANVTHAQMTNQPSTTGSAVQSDAASKLNESSVRASLRMHGYSEISDLDVSDRSGEAKAKRDDKDVSLKFTQINDVSQRPLTEENVRKVLEDEGYKSVENVEREGAGFKAEAEKDDDDVRLFVDSQGLIVEEQDNS